MVFNHPHYQFLLAVLMVVVVMDVLAIIYNEPVEILASVLSATTTIAGLSVIVYRNGKQRVLEA